MPAPVSTAIRNGDQYKVEAEDNRVSERLIAAAWPYHGPVRRRVGQQPAQLPRPLVSEQAREGARSPDIIAKVILITISSGKNSARHRQQQEPVPVPVAENLTGEFSRVNMHLPYLPGIQCDVGETRGPSLRQELVHILGYVAAVSPKEQEHDDDPLMSMPGMRIGKRGIEKRYDKEIRGKAGASRVEVNAYGRIIRELGKDPGGPGQDVYLTIDRQVQALADQKLGDESAAMVVMDVNKAM